MEINFIYLNGNLFIGLDLCCVWLWCKFGFHKHYTDASAGTMNIHINNYFWLMEYHLFVLHLPLKGLLDVCLWSKYGIFPFPSCHPVRHFHITLIYWWQEYTMCSLSPNGHLRCDIWKTASWTPPDPRSSWHVAQNTFCEVLTLWRQHSSPACHYFLGHFVLCKVNVAGRLQREALPPPRSLVLACCVASAPRRAADMPLLDLN